MGVQGKMGDRTCSATKTQGCLFAFRRKQVNEANRGPVGLSMNSSVFYCKGKHTEHVYVLTQFLLIYCTYTATHTGRKFWERMQLTRVLLLMAQLEGDCLHAEKHSLALCLLRSRTHPAGELPEPTFMSCGGGVRLLEMCPAWKSTTFSLPFLWISYRLLPLACLCKVSDKAMETLLISYIFTLYSNMSTDGERLIATTLHTQNDNIFQSPV